jgi:hypothetical protein
LAACQGRGCARALAHRGRRGTRARPPSRSRTAGPPPARSVVGVVRVLAVGIADADHVGDGGAAGAEHPGLDQDRGQRCRGPGEEVGEEAEQTLPGDDRRVVVPGRRAGRGRRRYRVQERVSVGLWIDNCPNGDASPSATPASPWASTIFRSQAVRLPTAAWGVTPRRTLLRAMRATVNGAPCPGADTPAQIRQSTLSRCGRLLVGCRLGRSLEERA